MDKAGKDKVIMLVTDDAANMRVARELVASTEACSHILVLR